MPVFCLLWRASHIYFSLSLFATLQQQRVSSSRYHYQHQKIKTYVSLLYLPRLFFSHSSLHCYLFTPYTHECIVYCLLCAILKIHRINIHDNVCIFYSSSLIPSHGQSLSSFFFSFFFHVE